MSQDKLEINYPVNVSKEENEIEDVTRILCNEEELSAPITVLTSSQTDYTEEMLLDRINKTGLLDDYLGGTSIRSAQWLDHFSRDDLIQIFTTFPKVYERCCALMRTSLGTSVSGVLLFNDTFCALFEDVLQKAKNVHLRHGWGFGEDTDEFNEFELAISLLHTFLAIDAQTSPLKGPNLSNALDKFAESGFVRLDSCGLAPIYTQLQKISQYGQCSAGFSEQLSRIYTAMTLVRTVLFYGNILQESLVEQPETPRTKLIVWDYCQSALFFKMKPELKKEMEAPLYHGTIDTLVAKDLLSTAGDYLARYSSNYKEHYFTILLDCSEGNKIVWNLKIPLTQLEGWIKKPMEHREAIELFIKEQLSMNQSDKIQPFIKAFFEKEYAYSPVFNPVCSAEMTKSLIRVG